jgi:hypothetical protein
VEEVPDNPDNSRRSLLFCERTWFSSYFALSFTIWINKKRADHPGRPEHPENNDCPWHRFKTKAAGVANTPGIMSIELILQEMESILKSGC